MTELLITLISLISLTIINLTLADTNSTSDSNNVGDDNEIWNLFAIGVVCILLTVFLLMLCKKCCKNWSERRHIQDEEIHMEVFEKIG
tara:strand:+ start:398 stop:661 length:264 start_codon:yes stop_codon:yes gene_type:complete